MSAIAVSAISSAFTILSPMVGLETNKTAAHLCQKLLTFFNTPDLIT